MVRRFCHQSTESKTKLQYSELPHQKMSRFVSTNTAFFVSKSIGCGGTFRIGAFFRRPSITRCNSTSSFSGSASILSPLLQLLSKCINIRRRQPAGIIFANVCGRFAACHDQRAKNRIGTENFVLLLTTISKQKNFVRDVTGVNFLQHPVRRVILSLSSTRS